MNLVKLKLKLIWEILCIPMIICDLVRDRKNQDTEIFSKAWNLYIKKDSKNIWKLREYAKVFGISQKIEEILEVIVYE